MRSIGIGALVIGAMACSVGAASAQQVERLRDEPAGLQALAAHVSGRVVPQGDGSLLRQWPGTYFESAFKGDAVYFRVGAGDVNLSVKVDAGAPIALQKPAPGLYRVSKLAGSAEHRIRVAVGSENQYGASSFGGFLLGSEAQPVALARRVRQVEFIGDSHTVGYGNLSPSRDCTGDQLWATTDTSQGIGALVAAHYDADVQVNAISGRGIVRNYDGGAGDTLPQAYPFALFDKSRRADDAGWQPQVIAIGLGTNDFSTALRAGEPWATRDQLQEAYEATYVRFVDQLHRRHPGAYVVLWIAAGEGSEGLKEVARVAEKVRQAGNPRVGFVPVTDLSLSGCHYHPSVADDRKVADAIARHLDAQKDVWQAAAAASNATPAEAPKPAAASTATRKLINDPQSVDWFVFGSGQKTEALKDGGPQGYPALRVVISEKGSNPWDVGAISKLAKPILAGDTVLVAVYLRAPNVKDGETTLVSYIGLNEGAPPYDGIAKGSANVGKDWKLFYASGKAGKAFTADAAVVGIHLAGEKRTLDLGPVLVYNFGPNVDPARLPINR